MCESSPAFCPFITYRHAPFYGGSQLLMIDHIDVIDCALEGARLCDQRSYLSFWCTKPFVDHLLYLQVGQIPLQESAIDASG